MRKFFTLLLLGCVFSDLWAQPTVSYFSLSSPVRQNLTVRGGARFARHLATSSGTAGYAFHLAPVDYSQNWRPYNGTDANGAISFNSVIDPGTNVNSARYNGGGGTDGNIPSITSGRYYTFNVGNSAAPTNNTMAILETSYNPVSISSVTAPPSVVHTYQTVTVSATLSAALNSGEIAVIRYTTDGFTTSQFVNMTLVSGTTYQGTIPLVTTTSTTVDYYVMTTNVSIGTLSNANADYLTLNMRNATGENVSGSNFSYTTSTVTVKRTTGSGNFNAAIWTPAGTPGSADVVVIQSGHNVTMNNGYNVAGLFINQGGTFTGSDASARTLTISSTVTYACGPGRLVLNNEGTFNAVNGTVAFSATGSVNPTFLIGGNISFFDVSVTNPTAGFTTGVNFGSGSTITGTFTINTRGYVCTNGPFYGVGSTLNYNTGGGFTCGAEWYANATSGQGIPYNVAINGNSTSVTFGTASTYRYVTNDFTMQSGNPSTFTLSSVSGGDLKVGGNFNIPNGNGTYTSNNRALFLIGSGDQNINTVPAAVTINYLIIEKPTGKVNFTGGGAQVTLLGTSGGNALQILNYPTQISLGSKLLSIHGTISWFTGSALEGSTTASIALNNNAGSAPGQVDLRFAPGFENLNNLTVNRGATGLGGLTLTSSLSLAGSLTLTRGTIQFGNTSPYTLTVNGTFAPGNGTERVVDMSGGNLAHELILNGTNSFGNNLTSFLAGTGGATGSRVTYSGAGNQNVFGNHTYNRLAISGAGTKSLQNGNISVFSLAISGTATFNVQNSTVAGNATGTMSVGSGATFLVTGGALSCAPFPTNFVRANISLDPASTVQFNYNADPSVSSEPVYGNLTINFSSGSGNKSPRCALGPGGFTTLRVDGNLNLSRSIGTGGNNIFNLTLNGGFNLDLNGSLISTGLAGTAALNIEFTSQNLNIAGSTNGFGNATVGGFQGTQTGIVTYDGSADQTLRAMVHNNVTFTGAGVKSLASGVTSPSVVHFRVNGTANMNTAIVDLVNVNFDIAPAASVTGTFSSTNMFRTTGTGLLRRYDDAQPFNYVFPIGSGSVYNPATVNITTATYSGIAGSRFVGVRVVSSEDPALLANDANTLDLYWNIVPTNISAVTNGNLSFIYDDSQVTGSDAGFAGAYNENGAGSFQASLTAVNTATNVILFSSSEVTTWNSGALTGNWMAAAPPNIPGAIVPFFTRQDGPWSDPNTWSVVAFGGAAASTAPPNSGAVVRIGNGNTVTLDVSTVTSIADLQIQSTGVFDIGTESVSGSSFSGSGTLRLSAASGTRTFPTFTTNSFLTTNGSIVEYNGNTSYNLPSTPGTYQSVIISGGGTKTLTGNLLVAENLTVNTSGTTLELSTFTFNRSAVGGTCTASPGTTVRTAFTAGGLGQNAFPNNFSTYALTGSTAEFYGTTNQQTINSINYHNLILSGNRGGNTIRFGNNPTGCSGTFDVSGLSNYTTSWGGGGGRIDFNGTGAQFVPSFLYQRIEVSGNKGGATVTFDPAGVVSVHDQIIFSATNVSYTFTNNTIEFAGKGNGSNFVLSNNPTGFPYNNIVISGNGATNTVGTDVNINGSLTINTSRSLTISTGSLTMGTGSFISLQGTLSDNNIAGTNTLNNCNITIGPSGLLDLSQSNADLGTTTGTLTFDGGTIGGAATGVGSFTVSNVAFTGDGTIGRGDFTVTNAFTLPSPRILSFTSIFGTKSFASGVDINGDWNNTGNQAITFNSNLNVNSGATFTPGTGIYSFNGTSTIAGTFAGVLTIPNISITPGSTATNQRTAGLAVNSFGTGTGTFIQGANAVLNYGSAAAITPSITATASGNTFAYTVGSSNVKSTTYFNLDLQGGGTHVLGGNVTVNGNIQLNGSSICRTNANILALSTGATISGAGSSAFVWGNFQKPVPAGNPSVTYEIGNNTLYAPITLNFTGVTVAGDLVASTAANILSTPGGILLDKSIAANRSWTLQNANTLAFTSFNGVFNFDAGDYTGGATNPDLRGAIHDGISWSYPSTTNLVGNSATLNNVNTLGVVILASCINPVSFTLSGTFSGAHCAGSAGTALSLNSSQVGVDYQLRFNGVDEGTPLAGTGSGLSFGDYIPNGAYTVLGTTGLTGCNALMNGTVNVVTNPLPTLSGASQTAVVCSGLSATVNLSGLLPSSSFTVNYSIDGLSVAPVSVSSDGSGNGSFLLPVNFANNGQLLEINSMTNLSLVPTCAQTFSSSNSFTIGVNPRPTVDVSANDFVCVDQTAPINFFFTGTGPWTLDYKINGVAQTQVVSGVSPFSNPYVNATVGRSYEVTALSDANCPAIASGLDSQSIAVPIPCAITWNGSVNNDWNEPDNWTPNNSAPSPVTSVIIPGGAPNQPVLTASETCASVNITGSASPSLSAGVQWNVRGNLYGVPSGQISGDGKVVLMGTGLQTVTGMVRIRNLEFANTSGNGVVVEPGSVLQIEPTGTATFLANSKVTNNGRFVLSSNAASTARIGIVPTSAIITGDITQQRYLPYVSGASGAWYFIGSPFSGKNFTNWADNFRVSGLSTAFGSQGGGILPSIEPERSTIFKYVEADHHLRIDTVQKIGWTIPGAVENIVPGTGYRTYVNYASNGTHLFDNSGSLTRGDFNFPTLTRNEYAGCIPSTYPCSETSWRGWNLLANPYACDVDWDAAASWTKPASMGNAWYRWNALGQGYGVYTNGVGYIGASPNPANPHLIPSGQAFYVRLTTPGTYTATLSIRETAKSLTTQGTFQRTAVAGQKLKVILSQSMDPNAYSYSTLIRFNESASDGIDFDYDFASLGGSRFSIAVPVENSNFSIATFAPVNEMKSIPLYTSYQNEYGNFVLRFSDQETLSGTVDVYLRDNLLGVIQPIGSGTNYTYTVTPNDPLLYDRFEIVFTPATVTGIGSRFAKGFDVFPNPSNGTDVSIRISDTEEQEGVLLITDVLGKELRNQKMDLKDGGFSGTIRTGLPSGVYNIEFRTQKITRKRTLVIR